MRLNVVLENIRVASPCNVPWEDMAGNDRIRFCGRCEKQVFNLTAMTRSQAEHFVSTRAGEACATWWQRADGTILTSDCPEGRRILLRERWKLKARGGGFLALLVGLALVPLDLFGRTGDVESLFSAARRAFASHFVSAAPAPKTTTAPSRTRNLAGGFGVAPDHRGF